MFLQLNPPMPLETPKGKAWAVAMIDYGPHWDLQWITFVQDTGECWTFLNRDVRQEANLTFGIGKPSPIQPPKKPNMPAVPTIMNDNIMDSPKLNGSTHYNGYDLEEGRPILHDYSEAMRPAVMKAS